MAKVAVITGANRGIGLSLTKQYLSHGYEVYGVCRRPGEELANSGARVIEQIDVTQKYAANRIAEQLSSVDIDLLVNNAGILRNDVLGSINPDQVRLQFETNAMAPLLITEALLPNLSEDAKIAFITSRMGSITDNTSGGRYGYRMSKVALNIIGVSLAHDLKPRGISVALLHPGLVGTDMIGRAGDVTPDESAALLVQRIDECNLDNSGTFWHANGEILPW
jgi:NAD(P)-dependent dehydrogenase (short-subunit alcohol dehydrogenase family)